MAITTTTKKSPLQTNSDLTSEPWDLTGRTTPPPLTPTERLDDRATFSPAYGSMPTPPAPLWRTIPGTSTAIPGGRVTSTSVQLFWRSNVGAIAAKTKMPPLSGTSDADPTNAGSRGLDGLGIVGHHLYIAEAADPPTDPTITLHGTNLDTIVTDFWGLVDGEDEEDPPVNTHFVISPSTEYRFQVASIARDGTVGAKSAILSVTTPTAAASQDTPPFLVPGPPRDFKVTSIDDPDASTPKAYFSWAQGPLATHYELYYRIKTTSAAVMDPSRPGLMIGDVLVATVAAPGTPTAAVTSNMAIAGRTTYTVKVRAKRTVSGTTAYSAFAPAVVLRIEATDGVAP